MTSRDLSASFPNALPLRTRLLQTLVHGVFRRPASSTSHPLFVAHVAAMEEGVQADQFPIMETSATENAIDTNTIPANPLIQRASQPPASLTSNDAAPKNAIAVETCDICQEHYPPTPTLQNSLMTPSTESLSKRRKLPDAILVYCECDVHYCSRCVKRMFVNSLTDPEQMPPRCCHVFPLFLALPYISTREAKLFREKFEEWSCSNKLYCPVPTCSAFIPERLHTTDPTTNPTIACPKCRRHMCSSCHARAHPERTCDSGTPASAELKATLTLVMKWGYKRCPGCGNGVKRMFGCSHMQCVCGAHWCWACRRPYSKCAGLYACERADEGLGASDDETPDVDNLDASAAQDWEMMNLDFGDEPAEHLEMRYPWGCQHRFVEMRPDRLVMLGYSEVARTAARGMECCRCWAKVQVAAAPDAPLDVDSRASTDATKATISQRVLRYSLRPRPNSNASSSSSTPPATTKPQDPDAVAVRTAWECSECRMLHCKACMIAVLAKQNEEQVGDLEAVRDDV